MKNIFLAEDDTLMVHIYDKAFKIAGFDLTVAMDGQSAIDILKTISPKPDIAILDIMMPNKTGLEVLDFMKKNDSLKNIPVILLTNLFGEKDEKNGLALGADAYLIKSQYTPTETINIVKEIYDRKIGNKKK